MGIRGRDDLSVVCREEAFELVSTVATGGCGTAFEAKITASLTPFEVVAGLRV